MKNIILILIAAIMCSTANAQTKTDALNAYISRIDKNLNGTNVTPDSGIVVFKYERSEVTRKSDGVKNFDAVLKDAALFQNSVSWGNMKTIIVNGKTFGGMATATPEQVKPLFGDEKPKRTFFSMVKDSTTLKGATDQAKQGYDEISFWTKNNWGYVFSLFDYVSYFLWCVGILFYLYSRVAAREFQHTGKLQDKLILGIQRTSALVLMCIAILIASIYVIQLFFVASDWALWMPFKLAFLFGVVCLITEIIVFVVPNTKHGNGGFWQKKGGGDDYERKQLQNRN